MADMTEDEGRAAVVAAARAWVGTPYQHMADVPGAGVDCAMILVRVFCDLGLVEPFDPRPYTRDWMIHRSEEKYLGFLLASARIVQEPKAGDVILFRFGRCFAHGGIVTSTDPLTILHAYAPYRCVVEEDLARNSELSERASGAVFASYWGAAE